MLRIVTVALLSLLLSASAASAQEPTPLPAPPGSEAEPNQTPDIASPIEPGERIRAVRTLDDPDVYRFTADAGDRVFAAVITIGASAGGDSQLALLGTDGETVIESDDDNGSLTEQSSTIAGATIPTAGTYYLRVGGGEHLMPYDLLLDVKSDTGLLSGSVAGEQDVYGLELGAGDTVFLSLDLDPERDGATFNGRLAFGNELVEVNDSGAADGIPSEAFVGTVATAGDYQVTVDAAAGSGTYSLSVTVIRAVERGCRTYGLTPSPGTLADRGATSFPIEVTDAGTIDHVAVRLDLDHPYMRDLDVTLEGPAGNRAALFDDIGNFTVGSANTRMSTLFDENAATPPVYAWLEGSGLQPERGALSYFVGQPAAGTWTLTFRDDALEDVGALARADLILCMRPEEGPVDTVFAAGFEEGEDGFTHTGDADEWEHGTPAMSDTGHLAGLSTCAEGSSCFKTDLDGTYEANSRQDLVSPPISLAGRTGVIYASWQAWYQLEGASYDRLTVSVEEDGGANARPLFTWTGGDMIATHGAPLVAFGLAAGWGRHLADVSDYAGKTIRLRFHLDSDLNVQRRGVAIDDVRLYEALQPLAQTPVGAVEDPPVVTAPSPSPAVGPAAEPAISDLQLESRCVRRAADGRVRVAMIMRIAQPGPVRVRIDRAVGSRARRSCPRANPERNQRYRRVATFRRVARVRAQAAAVKRRVTLDVRLRPGLYRLSVRVGDSPPVRRFMRVVAG